MKPKNFPGRKYRRQFVAVAGSRDLFDRKHPEIADMCFRIGKEKRSINGTAK